MKNIDPFAIHEASHFIVYLSNCIVENKYPTVNTLSLIPIRKNHSGYIQVNDDYTTPELIKFMLDSNDLPLMKEEVKSYTRRKIVFLLAGIAGEFVQLGTKNYSRALSVFYKSEKKNANSDLSKAIAYNIVIGEQEAAEGAVPLAKILNEAVELVLSNWNSIIEIAELLQIKRQFSAEELEILVDEYSTKLQLTTKSIFDK